MEFSHELDNYYITVAFEGRLKHSVSLADKKNTEVGGKITIRPNSTGEVEISLGYSNSSVEGDDVHRVMNEAYAEVECEGIYELVGAVCKALKTDRESNEQVNFGVNILINDYVSMSIKEIVSEGGMFVAIVDRESNKDAFVIGMRNHGLPDMYLKAISTDQKILEGVINGMAQLWKDNDINYGRVGGLLRDYDVYVEKPNDEDKFDYFIVDGVAKFYHNNPDYDKVDKSKHPEFIKIHFPDMKNRFYFEEGFGVSEVERETEITIN